MRASRVAWSARSVAIALAICFSGWLGGGEGSRRGGVGSEGGLGLDFARERSAAKRYCLWAG